MGEKKESNEASEKEGEKATLFRAGTNLIDVNYMHLNEKKKDDKCGYCKNSKQEPGSATWGIGAVRLSAADYQVMMDRGWRRCGTYTYKYDLEKSCCQPYTIRLDVTEFIIS